MANGRRNDNDPWRSPRKEGPADLIHIFKKLFRINTTELKPGRTFGTIVLAALAIWVLAGIFLVSPAEQAVVLRFGKYVRTVGPGPHWIPVLFERHFTVNIQRVESFPDEAEMLTQDGNIVAVKIQVQYRIADLKDYLFNVVSPLLTLHQAASSALRQVVGQMDLDPILTTGREELSQKVTDLLKKTLASYYSGIEVREVTLQSSKPPEAVTGAFDDVIKATEDEKRYVNQAEAYAKKRVLIAQGEVARIAQEADAYRYSTVAQATGATVRYLALLKPYQQAPGVTRERLYLDTVTKVLKNTHNIIVDGGNNQVLYLPLEQLLHQAPPPATPSAPAVVTPPAAAAPAAPADDADADADARPTYPLDEGGGQ